MKYITPLMRRFAPALLLWGMACAAQTANAVTLYEAEEAVLFDSTVGTFSDGYTGTGYAVMTTAGNSYIEWTVTPPEAGSSDISFRHYTNSDNIMTITVNGLVVDSNYTLAGTGSTWGMSSVTGVSLAAGANTIRLTRDSGPDHIRMDHLSVDLTIPLSIAVNGIDPNSNLQIGITGQASTPYYIYQSSDLTVPQDRWSVAFSGLFPASNQVDLVGTAMTAAQQFYFLSEASPIDALPVDELDVPAESVALALAGQVITYKTTEDGQDLQLHVYFPDDLQPGEQRPTLLFIHGGGWREGAPSVHALESLYFSRRGLVTVTISYNLLPNGGTAATPLECFADVKAAMRYLRDHASELRINPDQIVSSGGSAGGHLAAALATLEPDKSYAPNAMILLAPAYDLVNGWATGRLICTEAGIDPAAFSPALHVDAATPPTLILAGRNDGISKPTINRAFVESMRQKGNYAEFIEYAGKGHALFPRDKADPHFRATIYYMERFLRELGYLDISAALPENIQVTETGGSIDTRIMCVGDSITEGGTDFFIYRPLLNLQLEAAGYPYEFVGSKSSTHDGVVLKHEGYSGNNAEQVAAKIAANFANNIADIVLIHAGHNYDLSDLGQTETLVIDKVDAATRSMIATARSYNPEVAILLAQVITSTNLPKYAYIPALNVRLASIAAELHTEAQPVLIVNQAEGWDPVADTVVDLVHPSLSGATKMADKWFNTLVPLLSE
jgi:acetyl esterase/lipase/lysophospholipase L1-like esterase